MGEDRPGSVAGQAGNQLGLQNRPFMPKQDRFESILTVPAELQQSLFRWTSEFDVCDKAASLGKALDLVTDIYCELLSQFARTSVSRERFMQAPTEFMVTPMYYCDRAIDGIVRSIVRARENINLLFAELRVVHAKCVQNQNAAQKVYQEVEMDAQPDMGQFIEHRKAKVAVFRELSERISSIQEAGDVFKFLGKPWCEKSALCSQIVARNVRSAPFLSNRPVSLNQPHGVTEIRAEHDDMVREEANPASCTPDGKHLEPEQAQTTFQVVRQDVDVPETPETVRPLTNEGPVTQVSSPRRTRCLSGRKRARDLRTECNDIPVARNLIPDPSQPSERAKLLDSNDALQSPIPAACIQTTNHGSGNDKTDGEEDQVMVDEDGEANRGASGPVSPRIHEVQNRAPKLQADQDHNTPHPAAEQANAVAQQPATAENSQRSL